MNLNMFEGDIIDENLLNLTSALKTKLKVELTVKLSTESSSWFVEIPNWLQDSVISITCYPLEKKKFRVLTRSGEYDIYTYDIKVSTVIQVINSIWMMLYMEKGIDLKVINFLAKKSHRGMKMEKAVKLIAGETDIILKPEEQEILGITEQKGRFLGKKFGI